MVARPNWKAKRAADQKALAAMRDAKPEVWEDVKAAGLAYDRAKRDQLEGWLRDFPDHANVPLWRGVLERGFFTRSEWREARDRQAAKECERIEARAPVVAQGELF